MKLHLGDGYVAHHHPSLLHELDVTETKIIVVSKVNMSNCYMYMCICIIWLQEPNSSVL